MGQVEVEILTLPEIVDVLARHADVGERHVDVFAFVSGVRVHVVGSRFDPRRPQLFVSAQADERDVLYAAFAEPRSFAEHLARQRRVVESGGGG